MRIVTCCSVNGAAVYATDGLDAIAVTAEVLNLATVATANMRVPAVLSLFSSLNFLFVLSYHLRRSVGILRASFLLAETRVLFLWLVAQRRLPLLCADPRVSGSTKKMCAKY